MRTPNTHFPTGRSPNHIDSDTGELTLLLADLQAALAYLHGRDASQDALTFLMIQRHARRRYDEAISVLDTVTVADDRRRYLESQLAVLKSRLMLVREPS